VERSGYVAIVPLSSVSGSRSLSVSGAPQHELLLYQVAPSGARTQERSGASSSFATFSVVSPIGSRSLERSGAAQTSSGVVFVPASSPGRIIAGGAYNPRRRTV
jgi:hypothetical protein